MNAIEGFRALETIRHNTQQLALSDNDYWDLARHLAGIGMDKNAPEIAIRCLDLWKHDAEQLAEACQQLILMIRNETNG